MISFLYVQTVRHRGYFLSAEGDEAHALPEEGQTYAHVVRQSYNATHSNASNWYDSLNGYETPRLRDLK
ncbi:MAG: hypothetical protein DMG40_26405 [Acidobacteria bacterium]|nr:MAG: hypothetical protein DMG40_26405 [Acidobacteriota bacterium]